MRTPTLPPATHTNTYVVGERDLAVIDPASPYPEERAALDQVLDALMSKGHRVVEILLTHHHLDHVSGAAHLAARLDVPIAAHRTTAALLDGRLAVDRFLDEGQRSTYGSSELVALWTPGHAPGHLVFSDERSGTMIAGDMVASIGTIIIDPPEGDMRLYLGSLERLRSLTPRRILPAHGEPIDDPDQLLAHYLSHRLAREAKVITALEGVGIVGDTVENLVPSVYPEVPSAIYPLAARSLLAHLIKLRDDDRVKQAAARWSLR